MARVHMYSFFDLKDHPWITLASRGTYLHGQQNVNLKKEPD